MLKILLVRIADIIPETVHSPIIPYIMGMMKIMEICVIGKRQHIKRWPWKIIPGVSINHLKCSDYYPHPKSHNVAWTSYKTRWDKSGENPGDEKLRRMHIRPRDANCRSIFMMNFMKLFIKVRNMEKSVKPIKPEILVDAKEYELESDLRNTWKCMDRSSLSSKT